MILSRTLIAVLVVGSLMIPWLAISPHDKAQNSSEPQPVGDPTRGEKIARSCSGCHGDAGISRVAWIPSLAGLNQRAIYKQLDDYRSHRRRPEWYMGSIAQALSLQDSADVSAYYAGQTAGFAKLAGRVDWPRGTASCGSCHNAQNQDAPQIAGQQSQYLEIQLSLFAQGIRSNDRDEAMRKIASQLSFDEIRQISESLGGDSR